MMSTAKLYMSGSDINIQAVPVIQPHDGAFAAPKLNAMGFGTYPSEPTFCFDHRNIGGELRVVPQFENLPVLTVARFLRVYSAQREDHMRTYNAK
jgi:hypothetical protein